MPSGARFCGLPTFGLQRRRGHKSEIVLQKNNLLLESQNHSVASIMELFVSSLQNENNFSGLIFLKLQPYPISAGLALTRGCMANGSHVVRMDRLF